jgi:hypothetical protein
MDYIAFKFLKIFVQTFISVSLSCSLMVIIGQVTIINVGKVYELFITEKSFIEVLEKI